MCLVVSLSFVPDFWFADSFLITLSGKLVLFVMTKDKPKFSSSQFHSSQLVKMRGHELVFPPNFSAITDEEIYLRLYVIS